MTIYKRGTYPDRPIALEFTDDEVVVTLATGEVVRNPIAIHPWLAKMTPEQRARFEFNAYAVEWPDFDQGLDIEGMRQGIPSATPPDDELSDDERALIRAYRTMRADARHAVLMIVDQLAAGR